jgi:hypothetical protein
MTTQSTARHIKFFLIPLFFAVSALILVFVSLVFGWFGPAEGVGGNFCEAARDALVKQPSNTYSNFAFIIFGLLAAWQLYKGKFNQYVNSLTRTQFFPIFFCTVAVLLGPGSMAMHASEAKWGGYFDMLSMYMTAALMFSYASQRTFKLSNVQFFIAFVIVLAVCHYFNFSGYEFPIVGFAGNFIFGFFIVSAMGIEVVNKIKNKPSISFKWAILCSLTFIAAFLIWTTGRNDHPWCDPHSLIQAHAVWHILNGLAIYFLFRFYVSESKEVA